MTSARTRRPSPRWMVPAAAAALVVGGPALASLSAERVELPPRSAEQLLVSLQDSDVDAWSGTVSSSVDLGIPGIRALASAAEGTSSRGLGAAMLLEGDRTLRVWHDGSGEDAQARVSIQSERGEYTVVRDGATTWTYASDTGAVTRAQAPKDARGGQDSQSGQAVTPDLLAQTLLLTLEQSSDISVDGTALVAGRPAYELVVAPRSTDTLIGSLRLAVDSETSLPLRAEVYARGVADPVISVAYDELDLATPDPDVFAFAPPPGAEVETVEPFAGFGQTGDEADGDAGDPTGMAVLLAGADVRQVGTSFDTVLVGRLPAQALALAGAGGAGSVGDGSSDGESADSEEAPAGVLDSLPRVSGPWGEGRLLRGALFSVVLTDDGRVAVGAVRPQALYAALAS